MRRNTTASTNRDARVLPTYQRLLTPSASGIYPYQSPPLQNGLVQPGLFLIDRGRKVITIAGASPVTINQLNQTRLMQPIATHPMNASHASGRKGTTSKTLESPGSYRSLEQVLGDKTQLQSRLPATTTATTVKPQSSRRAATQDRLQANGAATPSESRVPAVDCSHTEPAERIRRPSRASDEFDKPLQKAVFARTYAEHPTAHSTAPRTSGHSQSTRNTSPSTSAQSATDQRDPKHSQSRLVDTPTTSTKRSSDSSGGSRKRSHDNSATYVPSPKADTSNPTGKVLDKLSEGIWRNYLNSRQNTQRLYMKENLRQTLESIIQTKYQGTMLFLVGSSLNGFATNQSDTDLCLMVTNKELNQKQHATYILNNLHRLILQKTNFVTEAQVIHAKVPILKFVCSRTYSGLDCDININNATGIRNTHLLQTYSKIDWRVGPLVILIKQWASAQGINDASQGTLSSYSLVLMVVNYLQVKCKPCVLPCLHQLHSSTFNSYSDVRYLYDNHPSNPLPSYITFRSENTDTIWELLCGFFDYYVKEFRFQTTVICVRLGKPYPLASAPYDSRDWVSKYIYIEEPFDRNNTARAVYNDTNFRKILHTFEWTHRRLVHSNESDSDDPHEILDLGFDNSSRDTPPLKKKKR